MRFTIPTIKIPTIDWRSTWHELRKSRNVRHCVDDMHWNARELVKGGFIAKLDPFAAARISRFYDPLRKQYTERTMQIAMHVFMTECQLPSVHEAAISRAAMRAEKQ